MFYMLFLFLLHLLEDFHWFQDLRTQPGIEFGDYKEAG